MSDNTKKTSCVNPLLLGAVGGFALGLLFPKLKKCCGLHCCGSKRKMRVAVLLHGCGVYDGTEIQEACSVLFALSRAGAEAQCFSIDEKQGEVVNHIEGVTSKTETRNCLVESARISRGDCKSLKDLDEKKFDALIIPGGFGVAKNLSTFALKGTDMELNTQLESTFNDFQSAKKPIGMCCIAPILAARYAQNNGKSFKMTLGMASGEEWPYNSNVDLARGLGNEMVEMDLDGVCVDKTNLIVTSAAYMKDAKPHEVMDNVTRMVNTVLTMSKK